MMSIFLLLFQFHKGTIRTDRRKEENRIICHFNSIKVQLEHLDTDRQRPAATFQFHKGTIRTIGICYYSSTRMTISIP